MASTSPFCSQRPLPRGPQPQCLPRVPRPGSPPPPPAPQRAPRGHEARLLPHGVSRAGQGEGACRFTGGPRGFEAGCDTSVCGRVHVGSRNKHFVTKRN